MTGRLELPSVFQVSHQSSPPCRYRDFIIEEAEVDSDVDEDDEYEGDFGEIGIVGNEVEESGQTAREIENRRRMGMLWE
jgi:transcription elongation factor SPT5